MVEIADKYIGGDTARALSDEYGVTDVSIYNVLIRMGVDRTNGNVKLSGDLDKKICEHYRAGFSIREVARDLEIVSSTVLKVLRRNGREVRPVHKYHKLTINQKAFAAEAYRGGETLRSVAAMMDVSADTVRKCLKACDVPSRTGWGRFKTNPWTDRMGREQVFKSRWELAYAKRLDSMGVSWKYEPRKFILDGFIYTPDFEIELSDDRVAYHEVKGWLDKRTERRLLAFANKYPDTEFLLLGPNEMVDMGLAESYYKKHPMASKVTNLIERLSTIMERAA